MNTDDQKANGSEAPSDWRTGAWLIVDTETTGLDEPRKIVELGAVLMREGRVLAHRSALYNPGRPIDPGASAVHGIRDEHVADRRRIDEVDPRTGRTPVQGLDALCASNDVTAVVAYNGLTFDFPLLSRELGAKWDELLDAVGVRADPLVVVRGDDVGRYWKGKGRHRLTEVAQRLKLTEPEPGMRVQAHRAAWDCVLAGRILWRLREHVPSEAGAFVAWQAGRAQEQQQNFEAYMAAQGGRREVA